VEETPVALDHVFPHRLIRGFGVATVLANGQGGFTYTILALYPLLNVTALQSPSLLGFKHFATVTLWLGCNGLEGARSPYFTAFVTL
jgi:hypothetical protein